MVYSTGHFRGWCILVNMESPQDNHDKCVFECFYHVSPSVSEYYLPSPFPFNRGKYNGKPSSGQPKGGRRLILQEFYLQLFTDNDFGTLTTGRFIRGGRLQGWDCNCRGSSHVFMCYVLSLNLIAKDHLWFLKNNGHPGSTFRLVSSHRLIQKLHHSRNNFTLKLK